MKILEFGPEDKKLVKEMYRFPHRLYKDYPAWVPLLKMDLLGNKLLGSKGLLCSDHPFFQHARACYFLVQDESGVTLGTIAAVVNHSHNEYHKEKTGFFGFFEFINNPEVAKLLLDKAKAWLTAQGMEAMRGPANFSTNDTIGLLIENFDDMPFMYTPYNPPYYQEILENYGLAKKMDLLAELMPVQLDKESDESKKIERMDKVAQKIKERYNVTVETFVPKRHLSVIKELYLDAWKDNWGFVPLSDPEYKILADNLKLAADRQMIYIAYVAGKPAGFLGSLPDINEVLHKNKKGPEILQLLKIFWKLKRKKFLRQRLMLFGIKEEYRKMGLDALMFLEGFKNARKRNYEQVEISWLLETNTLVIQAGLRLNAVVYRKWRVYETPLG